MFNNGDGHCIRKKLNKFSKSLTRQQSQQLINLDLKKLNKSIKVIQGHYIFLYAYLFIII